MTSLIPQQYAEIVRDTLMDKTVLAALQAVLDVERVRISKRLRVNVAEHKFTEAAEDEAQLKLLDDFPAILKRHAAKPVGR